MNHDRLIERLTGDLKPVRHRRISVDIAVIAAICAAELMLFFAARAQRPDMPMQMHQLSFWWRLASLGLIAVISFAVAILSFHPVYSPRRAVRWLVLIAILCLAAGMFINAGSQAQMSFLVRLNWRAGLQCTYKMVLLSIPAVIGLTMLMRRGAPTDRARTALLAGLAAAAWGAFVFVFACPSNDPLYIAVWYSVGCAIVTVSSRLVLPRLSGW